MRLATALEDQPGLEAAHANLMGEVTLTWDDDVTTREALVGTLAGAGFHERDGVSRRRNRGGRSSAGRIALGGPHCEHALAPRSPDSGCRVPAVGGIGERGSEGPRPATGRRPARYLFDPGNSMAIPRSFAVAAKTDGARDLVRAGFVGGYFARYLNTGPPRWRHITSGAYLFRDAVGARKVLPSMIASMIGGSAHSTRAARRRGVGGQLEPRRNRDLRRLAPRPGRVVRELPADDAAPDARPRAGAEAGAPDRSDARLAVAGIARAPQPFTFP